MEGDGCFFCEDEEALATRPQEFHGDEAERAREDDAEFERVKKFEKGGPMEETMKDIAESMGLGEKKDVEDDRAYMVIGDLKIPLEDMKVVNLKKDSIVVFRAPKGLGPDVTRMLGQQLKVAFPKNKVMLISEQTDLEIIEPEG
jgi:hypothetical protein